MLFYFFHISCGLFNSYLPQRMLVKLNLSLVKFCGILSFIGPHHHKFIFVALLPSSYVWWANRLCLLSSKRITCNILVLTRDVWQMPRWSVVWASRGLEAGGSVVCGSGDRPMRGHSHGLGFQRSQHEQTAHSRKYVSLKGIRMKWKYTFSENIFIFDKMWRKLKNKLVIQIQD